MSAGIVHRDPATLREAADNPRTIEPEDFERLKRNLAAAPDMLEARPLILDVQTGEVVAGNMRLRAVLELGWSSVPTYEKRFRDAGERREWQMRDNVGFGDWVPDEVARLVALHRDEGGELELLGFSQADADGYLVMFEAHDRPPEDAREADEAPPLPVEPTTKLGDVIELGEHRLICGDAGDADVLERLLEVELDGASFAGTAIEFCVAVVSDPPYGIEHDTDYSSMRGFGQGRAYAPVAGDSSAELAGALEGVCGYLGDIPEWFLFGADYYLDALEWAPASWVVWDKRTESSDEGFGSAFELIASRSRHQRMILRHLWFGMFGGEDGEARNRLHPTQKPVGLMRDIIERWTGDAGAIVDPFAGSGSTLIACEQLRRPCYAVELDPGYCDVIVARWENYTGREARRP